MPPLAYSPGRNQYAPENDALVSTGFAAKSSVVKSLHGPVCVQLAFGLELPIASLFGEFYRQRCVKKGNLYEQNDHEKRSRNFLQRLGHGPAHRLQPRLAVERGCI